MKKAFQTHETKKHYPKKMNIITFLNKSLNERIILKLCKSTSSARPYSAFEYAA